MTLDTSIKYFDSTMSGAFALTATAGSVLSILDSCLVYGFGAVNVTSLVLSGNLATVTTATAHGFTMIGATGPVVRISGTNTAALNAAWRLESIPSATVFTFTTSGIADQTATGTITVQRAPLGWDRPFTGTNKAVYRASHSAGRRFYYRFDDSGTTEAALIGYRTMSSVDSGSLPFPATGDVRLTKKDGSKSVTPWILLGDQHTAWFVTYAYDLGPNDFAYLHGFGDAERCVASDEYASFVAGWPTGTKTTSSAALSRLRSLLAAGIATLAMPSDETGTSIAMLGTITDTGASDSLYPGQWGPPYPARPHNGAIGFPLFINHGGYLRARLRGLAGLMHTSGTIDKSPIVVGGAQAITLHAWASGGSGSALGRYAAILAGWPSP